MRAPLLAIALLALGILVACGESPRAPQVRATFVPGTGEPRASAVASTGNSGAPDAARRTGEARAQCDVQNSTLQDSGAPLLLIDPVSPRPGETVTVTSLDLAPGPHRLVILMPGRPDYPLNVTVAADGRLRATFDMPPAVPGQCAMLLLEGLGIQSLGFPVRE
ncbi:MAG: hypothetical protein WCI61_07000 [Chloroflexota bacterium]